VTAVGIADNLSLLADICVKAGTCVNIPRRPEKTRFGGGLGLKRVWFSISFA
jgi:hypothetical protein